MANNKHSNQKDDASIIESSYSGIDSELERSLRPSRFSQIIGRKKEKHNLKIMIDAALKRGESLDHVIFYGPPGLGKTTLAYVIAKELKSDIIVTSGPAIERQGDLASILTNIPRFGILFIDEIHRLQRSVEEILYPAMEDRAIDIIIGKGPSARSIRLELEDFTIIGATTRIGLLGAPLRNRFGASYRLDFYSVDDLKQMVKQKASLLNVSIKDDAALEIAKRSRGTARTSIRLLRRVRDYVDVRNLDKIQKDVVQRVLAMHEIDEVGLDSIDRKILRLIVLDFSGGPVGLSTIAAALSEELNTIAEVYEPYLIQSGFIKRTPRGRVVTRKGYKHIGMSYEENSEEQKKLV